MNSELEKTSAQYDTEINACADIFLKKVKDYGTSWRILRPRSLTDQIFIKAQRIRTLEQTGVKKIDEPVEDEYRGIINYAIIALIQMELPQDENYALPLEMALQYYRKYSQKIKALMEAKNHDYGEAWRAMRISSFTDLILMKLLRIRQIEENKGMTLISEGIDSHYMDIVNYAVFALIKSKEI